MLKISGEPSTSDWLLFQPVDEHDAEMMPRETACLQELCPQARFAVVSFQVNWFKDLTPWAAGSAFKGQPGFGDAAQALLQRLITEIVPEVYHEGSGQRLILGGYSLAGLFALWAAYQTELFSGIVAASPSVWYPGWIDYCENKPVHTSAVYLSLGNREERTKNPTLRTVGEIIRRQYRLLQAQKIHTILEWNEGNHFIDSDKRTAKGFAWTINALKAQAAMFSDLAGQDHIL